MEVVISTFLVGMLLVTALSTVAASIRAGISTADNTTAHWLAQGLLAEILTAAYSEPDAAPGFGPEVSETGGTRSAFDDVDDYHAWDASPPENRDGTPIPGRIGWRRRVTVEYVNPDNLPVPVGTDRGIKQITVTVERNGTTLAQLVGIRTDAD
jgi:hypothetical protein